MRSLLIGLPLVIATRLWAQPHEEALFMIGILEEVRDSMIINYEEKEWDKSLVFFDQLNANGHTHCYEFFIASECYKGIANSTTDLDYKKFMNDSSHSMYDKGVEYCGESLMSEIMTEDIYSVVEEMPVPKIGLEAYYKEYLEISYRYTEHDSLYGVQGLVYLSIIINKDGSIGGCRVLKGVSEDLDKEAIRMIQEGPEWKPGMQKGKAVYMSYLIVVPFSYKQNYKLRKKDKRENRKLNH